MNGERYKTYEDIIRLDVSVHDIAFAQQTQGQKELVSVGPDSTNVQTNVFPKLLNDIS